VDWIGLETRECETSRHVMWVDENRRGGEGARALRVGESLNGRESRKDPSSSAGPGPDPGPGSVVGREGRR
jgi:hypothetical protein